MIRYVDKGLETTLQSFVDRSDISACRIACLLQSYGTGYGFADFYLQLDEEERPVSAAAKYYSDMTVMLTSDSDIDELGGFIEMTSPASVLLAGDVLKDRNNDALCQRLNARSCEECIIMKLRTIPEAYVDNDDMVSDPELRDIWELLHICDGDGIKAPSWEDFLLDMSHRLRHGTAMIRALVRENKPAGVAMTVALSERCTLIGAVAVSPRYRRQGIGASCMRALCSALALAWTTDIYILRERDRNEDFYSSLGFEAAGKALIINRAD